MPKTKVINGNLVKKNILYERESINQVDFVEDLTVPFCTLLKYIYCVLFSFASTSIFSLKEHTEEQKRLFQCELFNGSKDHFFDITFITECAHDFMVTSKKHGFVHISAQFDFPPKNTCTSDQQ